MLALKSKTTKRSITQAAKHFTSNSELSNLKCSVESLLKSSQRTDEETYISLLAKCSQTKALLQGKQIHAHVAKHGSTNMVLVHIIRMYGSCGAVSEAHRLFNSMHNRGQYEWNALLTAYTQNGHLHMGMSILQKMPLLNAVSWNTLIVAFSREGYIHQAREIFEEMPEQTIMSWNAMITAYAQCGQYKEALYIFKRLELDGTPPNDITFLGLIDVCDGAETAKKIHLRILGTGFEHNFRVSSALVNMYGKCGSVETARKLFNSMPQRNTVTWNGMLAAYAQNGCAQEALDLFEDMKREVVRLTYTTYLSLIEACSQTSSLEVCKEVHDSVVKLGFHTHVKVVSSLITMYGRLGEVSLAREVFSLYMGYDSIVWTSMVTAYARSGHGKEAVRLLPLMDIEGMKVDKVTFISLLDAACVLTDLKIGKLLHRCLVEEEIELDVNLSTSLVCMYGKCGSVKYAKSVFDSMPKRTVVSWNSIISAYAQNGYPQEGFSFFQLMELQGYKPNALTLTCTLLACSHAGMVTHARDIFVRMRESFNLQVTIDHYACMIDLLARVGKLEQAEELVDNMPFEPDLAHWTSLLSACNVHKNVKLGIRASERVQTLLPDSQCAEVMLRNVIVGMDNRNG